MIKVFVESAFQCPYVYCFIKGQTSKGAFLLVLLDLRFHIKVLGNVLKKL